MKTLAMRIKRCNFEREKKLYECWSAVSNMWYIIILCTLTLYRIYRFGIADDTFVSWNAGNITRLQVQESPILNHVALNDPYRFSTCFC